MSDEAHQGPTYFTVFVLLVVAFGLSLVLGALSTSPLAIFLIFALATVKAYLVLTYFMHLRIEPHYIKIIVASAVLVLAILYIGLVPDIVWVYGGVPK